MRISTLLAAWLLAFPMLAQNLCDGLAAAFAWNATSAAGGVQFSNTTTGTGQQTTWQWSFGDGTTSNEAQPFHVFPGPGTYQVCLTAITIFFNTNGTAITCVDDYCASVVIGGANNCAWLNADFTWVAGTNGVEFVYQPPTPGAQYAYLWSFGDGTTATTQNAFHAYAASGTYEACLTVTAYTTNSSSPCTATSCQPVQWSGGNSNPCAALSASFTSSAATAAGGVQFSNTTTGTGQQTTWQWSFGDGTTSNEAQPFHVFPGPGTYQVCLTAITVFISPNAPSLTCVDDYCASVVIAGEPQACDPSFALEVESDATSAGFILHATTNLPNQGIIWTFANGLVLYGSTIQVGLGSVLNIELCITAWYQPANSADTCWAEVCGLLSELGFAVGLGDHMLAPGLTVGPNPATDHLNIHSVNRASAVVVRVFNAEGQLERAQSLMAPATRLDLGGLPAGLKLVEVEAGSHRQRFKVIKE